MGPVVIVVVFPLLQFFIKQLNIVCNPTVVQQLVKLLIVHAMRALDFPIEMRRAWPDVDVPNVLGFEMPMELGLKFGPIVGLYDMDPKREPAQDVVHELDGRALIARVKDLQHPHASAIIDGGELIEPPLATGNALQEFHIQL